MKLFNTLSRQIDVVEPLAAPTITMYTCGPTVYDYAHIGHWFTYIRWDLLVRTLAASHYRPTWVMNITDVGHLVSDADDGEDKLEKGARREGKTAWQVAEFYTKDFLDCMQLLSITRPNFLTKATDHIPEQIALIQRLQAKGYTYTISDGVYFDTSKFEGYADFAKLDLDDLQAGARVEFNPEKHNASDFALWKFSPTDHQRDMEWEHPFDATTSRKGFPGWHIECSAMAMKYLGDTIDIHAGGIDHIPVHHSNEIAQSEAATGKRFSNYWLHSNHVVVNGEKISKSLGNGIRLQEIMERGLSPQALRLHVLESHYRSQSRFSWESLQAAQNRLAGYQAMADQRWQTSNNGRVQASTIETMQAAILTAIQDDLNTPIVLAKLSELETAITNGGIHSSAQACYTDFLVWLDELLGLQLANSPDINEAQKQLISQREAARQRQDWAKSDELRQQLTAQGIELKDGAERTDWRRIVRPNIEILSKL